MITQDCMGIDFGVDSVLLQPDWNGKLQLVLVASMNNKSIMCVKQMLPIEKHKQSFWNLVALRAGTNPVYIVNEDNLPSHVKDVINSMRHYCADKGWLQ